MKVDEHRRSRACRPLKSDVRDLRALAAASAASTSEAARVARGGIRWSDRHDDFRTEILDLVKTQMVKNSIIVPVGSKGGFVLKGKLPPRGRRSTAISSSAIGSSSRDCSTSPTTWSTEEVVHPPEVCAARRDDPYLVVAADKGTAHLSDTANSVAKHYGFWLGDAFASGGSVGYDHKKVGITARGAWECIKSPLSQLWRSTSAVDPFTVVAIGDMGGDVFGNGMLRSRARPGWWRRSTTSTSSSTRTRTPRRSFDERLAAVQAPALELAGLRRRRSSARAAGCSIRSAKKIPLSDADEEAVRRRQRET